MPGYIPQINLLYEQIKNIPVLTREEHTQHFKEFEDIKVRILKTLNKYPQLVNKLNGTLNSLVDDNKATINYNLLDKFLVDFYELCNNKEKIKEYGLNKKRLYTTKEKIRELHKKALEKRNFLVVRNLRFDVKLAAIERHRPPYMEFVDLIQEGSIGLLKSIGKFDYTKGNTVSTYSGWWIIQQMKRAAHENSGLIVLPYYLREDLTKLHKLCTREKLSKLNPKRLDNLRKKMNISAEALYIFLMGQDGLHRVVSLDELVADETDTEYIDTVKDPQPSVNEIIYKQEVKDSLKELLSQLSPREEQIIRRRFGLDEEACTLQEIGKEMGNSRERIRQIEERALRKLRGKISRNKKYKRLAEYFN
ncbi:MAG: sigma-70 family RNA polymerase sigma factor [Candidatus Nanoarchaeia archaeon]|nr:sigma-70 family RNA polymerase sigma factor [Candidatus Nanoarchaeia archaeon]MDD5588392.1 sigma-70 family RNA polymerase sigma factor [Candidatus Nanoarchaeia archaeon]